MESEHGFKNPSLGMSRSESSAMVGQKRGLVEDEDMSAISHKKVKMRDLQSVLCSEAHGGRVGSDFAHSLVDSAPHTLDLNTTIGSISTVIDDEAQAFNKDCNKKPSSVNKRVECNESRGFKLDLNAEDDSSSINHDPFYPYKTYEHSKSRNISECGSSIGPSRAKDPMRVWTKMKQNGYLSTTYNTAAQVTMPKPRVRKTKNDTMKKKIELAKKEQVDRFAKVAAPSGLLNGLNPGIINHVRNSKQVHSIIEALVRSERSEKHVKCSENKEVEKGSCLGVKSEDLWFRQPSSSKSVSLNSELTGGNGFSYKGETRICENEDDGLALKLSSCVTFGLENTSSMSNAGSANVSTTVTSLSIKAADVASQWLELLSQDIKGRLEALRRSKKRVRAVINTELPCLMSREFSSDHRNGLYAIGDAHFVKWRTMFGHMDKALSEEERQLENWLNQVKQMQVWSEPSFSKPSGHHGLLQPGPNNCRFREAESSERDLAVRAAAASMYSTCNFLLSMGNH